MEITSRSPATGVEITRTFEETGPAKAHVRFLLLCAGSSITGITGDDDGDVRRYADRQERIRNSQMQILEDRRCD